MLWILGPARAWAQSDENHRSGRGFAEDLFDLLGRPVRTLIDGVRFAGRHHVEVRAEGLPSGRYLYRLEAGPFVRTRTMTLVE